MKKAIFFVFALAIIPCAILAQGVVYETSYSDEFESRDLDFTKSTVSIKGEAGSMNGSAGYSIPINTPDGISINPNISINYSSNSGNGLLGIKWDLNAISSIVLGPSSHLVDGNSKPREGLYLDGKRLVDSKQGYFKSLMEDDSQIYMLSNGFEVKYKNGEIHYYGETSNSQKIISYDGNPISWLISKRVDKNGNAIFYEYEHINGGSEIILKRIKYSNTTEGETSATVKVEFDYMTRTDVINGFYLEDAVNKTVLLKRIKSYYDGNLYNQYDFEYSFRTGGTNNSNFSRLISINYQKQGAELNPTIIQWNEAPTSMVLNQFAEEREVNQSGDMAQVIYQDFNGDGYTDVLNLEYEKENDANPCVHGINSYTNTQHKYTVTLGIFEPVTKTFSLSQVISPFYSQYWPEPCHRNPFAGIQAGDFNGDGLIDFLLQKAYIINQENKYPVEIWINNPASPGDFSKSWSTMVENHLPDGYLDSKSLPEVPNFYPPEIYVSDLDNDGFSDFFYQGSNVMTTNHNSFTFIRHLNAVYFDPGLTTQNTYTDISNMGTMDTIQFGEFNGHPGIELVLAKGKLNSQILEHSGRGGWKVLFSAGFPNAYHVQYFADFNGDGLSDCLFYNNSDNWKLATFNGLGFEYPYEDLSFIPENLSYSKDVDGAFELSKGLKQSPFPFISDFDGDGRADIGFYKQFQPPNVAVLRNEFKVYFNKVDGWQSQTLVIPNTGDYIDLFSYPNSQNRIEKRFHSCNFNTESGIQLSYYHQNKGFLISFRPDDKSSLVSSILDGFNNKTSFEYEILTNSSIYSRTLSYQYSVSSLVNEMYVTKRISVHSNTGVLRRDELYFYEDMFYNNTNKTALGFGKTIVRDQINQKESVVISELVEESGVSLSYWPFLLKGTYVKDLISGALVSSSEITYESDVQKDYGTWWNYSVQTKEKREVNYLNQTSNKVTFFYDANRNVDFTEAYSYQNIALTGGFYKKTISDYNGYVSNGGIVPYLPSQVINSIFDAAGNSEVREENLIYDINGNLSQKVIDPSTAFENVIDFEYTTRGRLRKKTTTPTGMAAVEETFEYDPHQRYIVKRINPLGWEVNYSVDFLNGTITAVTDANGISEQTTYDVFDRKTSHTDVFGNVILTAYEWDQPQQYPSILHRVKVTGQNSPAEFTYFDSFGRELLSMKENFNGDFIYSETYYDANGNVEKTSFPEQLGNTPTEWVEYSYDGFNRVILLSSPNQQISTLYNSRQVEVIDQLGSKSTLKKEDGFGNVIESQDNGGTITFEYDVANRLVKTVANNGLTETRSYDGFGHLIETDGSAHGISQFDYYANGLLKTETDAKGNVTSFIYDILNREIERITPLGSIVKTYDSQLLGKVDQILDFNGFSFSYSYNGNGQIASEEEIINGVSKNVGFEYYPDGSLQYTYYPSVTVENQYSSLGFLERIVDFDTQDVLWQGNQVNDRGYFTSYTLGGLNYSTTYDANHLIKSFGNGVNIQRIYDFDPVKKNLLSRRDAIRNLQENFSYDNLDRLTGISSNTANTSISFDSFGNITQKSDVGSYVNNSFGQTQNVFNNPGTISIQDQDISYGFYNNPDHISEGGNDAFFTYGHDYQRKIMTLQGGLNYDRKYFFGGSIEEETKNGNTVEYTTIPTPGGGGILFRNDQASGSAYYFTVRDYLGSIIGILDQGGNMVEERSFDAWGNERDPNSWMVYISPGGGVVSNCNFYFRGYTDHEMLPEFGLINMNGRMYDPLLGRMLSPDDYVQSPHFSQNYNRYSYAFNNPLKYNDPSGEIFVPILIGMGIGAISNTIFQLAKNDFTFENWNLGSFVGSVVAGGIGGGLSSWLWSVGVAGFQGGAITGSVTGFTQSYINGEINGTLEAHQPFVSAAFGGILGGIGQGIFASLDGRNFWHGGKVRYLPQKVTPTTHVQQKGDMNCTAATMEMSLKGQGIEVDQADIRGISGGGDPDLDPLMDVTVVDAVSKEYGLNAQGVQDGNMLGFETKSDYVEMSLSQGRSVHMTVPGNEVTSHSVYVEGQYIKHVTYVNGSVNKSTVFKVFDPSYSSPSYWSPKYLNKTAFTVFSIWR